MSGFDGFGSVRSEAVCGRSNESLLNRASASPFAVADWRQSEADFEQFKSDVEDELPSKIWLVSRFENGGIGVGRAVSGFVVGAWNRLGAAAESIATEQDRRAAGIPPSYADRRATFDMFFLSTGMLTASASLEGVDLMLAEGQAANPVAGSVRYVNPTNGGANCVGCAIASDATLAGRAASAMPGGPWNVVESMEAYRPGVAGIPANGPAGIRTMLRNWGPGSRAIIWGTRGAESGHAFNVVNQAGIIRFLDGQTGGVAIETGYDGYYVFRTK